MDSQVQIFGILNCECLCFTIFPSPLLWVHVHFGAIGFVVPQVLLFAALGRLHPWKLSVPADL